MHSVVSLGLSFSVFLPRISSLLKDLNSILNSNLRDFVNDIILRHIYDIPTISSPAIDLINRKLYRDNEIAMINFVRNSETQFCHPKY